MKQHPARLLHLKRVLTSMGIKSHWLNFWELVIDGIPFTRGSIGIRIQKVFYESKHYSNEYFHCIKYGSGMSCMIPASSPTALLQKLLKFEFLIPSDFNSLAKPDHTPTAITKAVCKSIPDSYKTTAKKKHSPSQHKQKPVNR